jgi:preprotein translocase subunit SecG
MLQNLLLVLNMLVCVALVGVVLLQRSEGGAFGGGSPTGLVTARGAGDLLTRTTWILFALFLSLSLSLTVLGGRERSSQALLERLKNTSVNPSQLIQHPAAPTPAAPAPTSAPGDIPAQTPAAAPSLALPPPGAPATRPKPAEHATAARKPGQIITAPVAPSAPPLINTPSQLTLPPVGGQAPASQQPPH